LLKSSIGLINLLNGVPALAINPTYYPSTPDILQYISEAEATRILIFIISSPDFHFLTQQ